MAWGEVKPNEIHLSNEAIYIHSTLQTIKWNISEKSDDSNDNNNNNKKDNNNNNTVGAFFRKEIYKQESKIQTEKRSKAQKADAQKTAKQKTIIYGHSKQYNMPLIQWWNMKLNQINLIHNLWHYEHQVIQRNYVPLCI